MRYFLRSNSFTIFLSEIFSYVLVAVISILIARRLSLGEFGWFSVAVSVGQILWILTDMGMGQVMARRLRGNLLRHGDEIVSQLMTWRILSSVLVFSFSFLVIFFLVEESEARFSLMGVSLGILLYSLCDLTGWVLKGAGHSGMFALNKVLGQLFLLLLVSFSWMVELRLLWITISYAVAGGLSVLLSIFLLIRGKIYFHWSWPGRLIFGELFHEVLGLGVLLIGCLFISRVDVLLVSWFRGEGETGLYACATRIIDGFRVIPFAVYSACIPHFASIREDQRKTTQQFTILTLSLILGGFLVAGLIALLGSNLILILIGSKYLASLTFLLPLGCSLVFSFPNYFMFAFLVVNNELAVLNRIVWGFGFGAPLFINLLFLSQYGAVVCAYTRLLSEALTFILFLFSSMKYLQLNNFKMVGNVLRWPFVEIAERLR